MAARRTLWRSLSLLAGVLASCATAPRAPDEDGRPWWRVESAHLVVETDLDAGAAAKLTGDLERWRLAMTAALFPGAVEPRSRFRVIALRPGETRALHSKIAGFYSDRPFVGPVVMLGGGHGADPIRLVKHELAHAVIRENLPQVPQWLNEGMATFLETTELDEDTGVVEWGARHRGLSFSALHVENLDALLDPRPWPAEQVDACTSIAGRLVQMLVREHAAEVACFVQRLRAFEDPTASLDLCFPLRGRWASEILADGWGFANKVGTTQIKLPDVRTLIVRMNDADAHAVLALVDLELAARMGDHDPARPALVSGTDGHLGRALRLDEGQPLAAALAFLRREPDAKVMGALTAASTREHPEDWRSWALRAVTPGVGDAELEAAAGQAFRLEPERAEVLQELAYHALGDGRWSDGEALARRAAFVSPSSVGPRALWFMAFERQGNCAAARAVANNAPSALRLELAGAVQKGYAALKLGAPRCPLP